MLSRYNFIRQSLETHLFFARIMKEHAFFLQTSFTPRDAKLVQHADELRQEFDKFLTDCIALSNGVVSNEVLQSGEVITQYTLEAEKLTEFYTGVDIPTKITEAERGLRGGTEFNGALERQVAVLNRRAMYLIDNIIQFKTHILADVVACKMFTFNYPLLIDHILREAQFYLYLVKRLQARDEINLMREAYEQEAFWNRIMAEHSKFIRGLLDPSEEELIAAANNFGKEFDQLTCEAKEAMEMTRPSLLSVTDESLKATKELRDFKAQGTEGILECNVKSIIIPLLADHTLREANHYLRLLEIFS
ncbi:DUF2935 domain-containing protein [Mobilitalea sibirica]|uniref:DUF2935 domain-containing protein n=1 Tax=Mobilitalea sibirica TaxID=1462919 RepID=A0A8J7H1J0_9FIRM|nr:DUF2935 domain-containing protein [Mobilitalea sibirica]MBH1940050.1 DUF2935 domain-containing protein [Mobilitalea sibirica]